MKAELIPFYLAGRGVKSLVKIREFVATPDEVAEGIRAGGGVRETITEACHKAAKQIENNLKRKAKWMDENAEELATAFGAPLVAGIGGARQSDKDAAWGAYCDGMADELAHVTEADVLDALEGEDGGEEEDGDDSDDEDDDDDKPEKKK